MQEQAHDVLFDAQRVVVVALVPLDVAPAGLVVERPVLAPAARLAAEVGPAGVLLGVAERVEVTNVLSGAATLVVAAASAAGLSEVGVALELYSQ